MIDLAVLAEEREALRRRWRADGWHEGRTFADVIDRALLHHDAVPVRFQDNGAWREETVGSLCRAARAFGAALADRGIGAGDSVAVQLSAGRDALVAYLGIMAMGAILVPIVPIYGAREVGFILRQAAARLLVTPDRFRDQPLADRLTQFGALPALRNIVVTGASGGEWPSFARLEAQGAGRSPPRAADAAAPCLLIYTSGTSAAPKGVRHSHDTLLADFRCPLFADKGLFLNVLPAGHIGGLIYLLRPIVLGAEQIFLNPWDPLAAAELIARYGVIESGATPIFLLRLLEAADRAGLDLGSLRSFGLGGAGVTPDQVALTDARGFPSGRGYGLTEHPTISTGLGDAPRDKRLFTDGLVTPGNEVRIVDDDGHDVAPGAEGEIVSRGPELFLGYTDPELDRAAFLPGGWFRTGDIGRLDGDGWLTITDRKKDIIIRGGENISSKEVETILAQMPEIVEAAAVGFPDPVYGERVGAFVRLAAGAATPGLPQVAAHFAAAGAARQKTPERLIAIDDFPRVASGKIQKQELRRLLREEGSEP